jgi:hypothetical protein
MLIRPWPVWSWLCQNFDPLGPNMDSHQSEAEQPAEAPDARISITSTSSRWDSQPYLICSAHPLHGLQQQIEVEATLHLDYCQPLWWSISYSHYIAAVYFAFHAEPGRFQELLHGGVEQRLKHDA